MQTVMCLSIVYYFAVLWIFPYFMEPQVLASCQDFTMLDYKVDYDNHTLFASGNYNYSRKMNCAVLLKLVYVHVFFFHPITEGLYGLVNRRKRIWDIISK